MARPTTNFHDFLGIEFYLRLVVTSGNLAITPSDLVFIKYSFNLWNSPKGIELTKLWIITGV